MTFKFTVEGSSLLSINFTFSEQEVDIYVKLPGNPMIVFNGWRQWPRFGPLNLTITNWNTVEVMYYNNYYYYNFFNYICFLSSGFKCI